jgi:outer membrane murein-binding lipoprotein Lpp
VLGRGARRSWFSHAGSEPDVGSLASHRRGIGPYAPERSALHDGDWPVPRLFPVEIERLREQRKAQAEVERLKAEVAVIEADIERLRGHLQAMGGEGDGGGGKKNPSVERLLATEDQLQTKRKELDGAEEAVERKVEATRESLSVLAPGE